MSSIFTPSKVNYLLLLFTVVVCSPFKLFLSAYTVNEILFRKGFNLGCRRILLTKFEQCLCEDEKPLFGIKSWEGVHHFLLFELLLHILIYSHPQWVSDGFSLLWTHGGLHYYGEAATFVKPCRSVWSLPQPSTNLTKYCYIQAPQHMSLCFLPTANGNDRKIRPFFVSSGKLSVWDENKVKRLFNENSFYSRIFIASLLKYGVWQAFICRRFVWSSGWIYSALLINVGLNGHGAVVFFMWWHDIEKYLW